MQSTFDLCDLGTKDVFVINDINLVIPPSQIEIRKEDLTYRYRVLRTKIATKIPTGHGQVTIHTSIIFTDSQLLTLHRLLTQIRNNPFVYIDNRYIRESIVPDWSTGQNMAFIVTGAIINNLPGSPNAFVLELDLIWFNYFPYLHNYVFREEWQTNWLRTDEDPNALRSLTIGWTLDPKTHQKKNYPNVISTKSFESIAQNGLSSLLNGSRAPSNLDVWSTVQNEYISGNSSKRTIYEMESSHSGIEFDLLPAPNNMMPARIVNQPIYSNIYVRYSNMLQRDSLMKNFGINVEKDLANYDKNNNTNYLQQVFNVGKLSNDIYGVLPLNDPRIPSSLRRKWNGVLMSFNYGIRMHYHMYKEVRFPQKWHERMDARVNEVIGDVYEKIKALNDSQAPDTKATTLTGQDIAIPVFGKPAKITSPFGERERPNAKASKYHEGIDFRARVNTPIYAPEQGRVIKVTRAGPGNVGGNYITFEGETGIWKFLHLNAFDFSSAPLVPSTLRDEVLENGNKYGTVPRGTRIGFTGNTGNSTGPHLHLTYQSFGSSVLQDPSTRLAQILEENRIAAELAEVPEIDEGQSSINPGFTNYFDYVPAENLIESNYVQLDDQEKEEAAIIEEARVALELTEEESESLKAFLLQMAEEGWVFYDEDPTVTTVWKKLITINIGQGGIGRVRANELEDSDFTDSKIVMSNVTGSFSHIVAKIPILSQEFPTAQHLGSMEPEYQIEFTVLDDNPNDLDGISRMAQIVQSMRSTLQSNSRNFRSVINGWTLSVDTFITRLFGSYVGGLAGGGNESDFKFLVENDTLKDVVVTKRCAISNSFESTVPGSPGLSTITLGLVETNPYQFNTENLVSSSPTLQNREVTRKEILQAIYNKKVDPKYHDALLLAFIAHKMGVRVGNTTSISIQTQGLSGYDNYKKGINSLVGNQGVVRFADTSKSLNKIVIKLDSLEEIKLLNFLGIEGIDSNNFNFVEIDAGKLDGYLLASENPLPSKDFQENSTLTKESSVGDTQLGKLSNYSMATFVNNLESDISVSSLNLFIDYYLMVVSTVNTGNQMFSEKEMGGYTPEQISSRLYDLPFKTNMWKAWQTYLYEWVRYQYTGTFKEGQATRALNNLTSNINWPYVKKNQRDSGQWVPSLTEEETSFYKKIAKENYGMFGTATAGLSDVAVTPFNDAFSLILSGINLGGEVSELFIQKHYNAITRLVDRYMRSLPLNYVLPEYLRLRFEDLIGLAGQEWSFDDLIGDKSNKNPADFLMRQALWTNAYSCGNITWNQGAFNDNPIWEINEKSGQARITTKNGYYAGLQWITSFADPILGVVSDFSLSEYILQSKDKLVAAWKKDYPGISNAVWDNYDNVIIGNLYNSPFLYPGSTATEDAKILYINRVLAGIADEALADYSLLEILGLTHLMFIDDKKDFSGLECYPDLELPFHPYYGNTKAMYPDFYMWNIYEDANALNPELLNTIYQRTNEVIQNAYDSMARLTIPEGSGNEFAYDPKKELQISEVAIDAPIDVPTRMNPEGKEGMETFFYPNPDNKASVDEFKKKADEEGYGTRYYSEKPSEFMTGVRVSNFDAPVGQTNSKAASTALNYPRRLGLSQYQELHSMYESTTHLFGSKEGYASQELNEKNSAEIANAIVNTNFARPPVTSQVFDVDSLKKLARDASKDLISQKMSLKRAYPTFKFYFIEEDEFETRFINFDDFYAYNAVKDMRVVQSRKIAADLAIITLQNIAGTLDGTRRNVITDLDYVTGDAKKKMQANGESLDAGFSNDPLTNGTSANQPFGAVVLRPGLNVQLRQGYSNDPDTLHVVISGRIVDVVWNKVGDLAEITVQSFGAELEQVIKGTERDDSIRTYYTTHELLGSLMLEPEVIHFGHWEFGQIFQIGEAKDYRLDFTDYAQEGHLGTFRLTSWLTQWITSNPGLITAGVVGSAALNLFPFVGRGIKSIPALSRLLGRGGVVVGESAAAYKTAFAAAGAVDAIPLASGGGVIALKGKILAIDAGKKLLRQQLELASKNLAGISPEKAARLGTKTFRQHADEVIKEYVTVANKLNNFDDIAAASVKYQDRLIQKAYAGRFMRVPYHPITDFASAWTAIGMKPLGFLLDATTTFAVKKGLIVFGTLAVLDSIINFIYNIGRESNLNVQRWFNRQRATFFMTPQDDNLFPPHPKDYMILDKVWLAKVKDWILNTASVIATRGDDYGLLVSRFLDFDSFLDKRVEPDACQYQIVNSTIWDVFAEMTRRHPGWVYGTRPYGFDYRYTMFFGLPAQRYWAKGAKTGFIHRANTLRRFLDNDFKEGDFKITSQEFIKLYGNERYEEVKKHASTTVPNINYLGVLESLQLSGYSKEVQTNHLTALGVNERTTIAKNMNSIMESIALKEYLRAIEIRFQPFRRYHLLTSERNIVYNGIMGSEQAVINAVDLTYFSNFNETSPDGDIKSSLFKASAMIPEHMLRIAPVRYYNCKGWLMAQRYAMGELLDRVKDMYRGELIVLGDARIRPWDIAIVVDSYNDMVGPVEVEQVVHTFSHETGWLTEIKPSALVFANEISGWPIVEGMKLFAMAIQDIHDKYKGIRGSIDEDETIRAKAWVEYLTKLPTALSENALETAVGAPLGILGPSLAGYFFQFKHGVGEKYDTHIEEKYKKIFGAEGATLEHIWGSDNPPTDDNYIDSNLKNLSNFLHGIETTSFITGAGAAGVTGALAGAGKLLKGNPLAFRNPVLAAGTVALAGLTSGLGAWTIRNTVDFPSTVFLLGGYTLFLQCLKNDAIILVPLMKGGNPIVSGLAVNDPSMLWRNFRGNLTRVFDDTLIGSADLISLSAKYGNALWDNFWEENRSELTNESATDLHGVY